MKQTTLHQEIVAYDGITILDINKDPRIWFTFNFPLQITYRIVRYEFDGEDPEINHELEAEGYNLFYASKSKQDCIKYFNRLFWTNYNLYVDDHPMFLTGEDMLLRNKYRSLVKSLKRDDR